MATNVFWNHELLGEMRGKVISLYTSQGKARAMVDTGDVTGIFSVEISKLHDADAKEKEAQHVI